MPLDTCINNVGEYYSSHYLDTTFAKDVASLVGRWKEQGGQAVPRRVQALGAKYFRAKTQALDETQPEKRAQAGDEVAGWHSQFLHALGYADLERIDLPVEGGHAFVPALGRVNRYSKPWLVICETWFCLPEGSLKAGQPDEDPLEMLPHHAQLTDAFSHHPCAGDWGRCLGCLFKEEDAPCWVLFLAGSQVSLFDRNTYAQGRWLSFDLDDIFGRKERDCFNHLAAFLSAETLCPGGESDDVLHDRLEEQNHRFAHGVTEALQHSVREAIELLVNDWAYDRTERQRRPLTKMRPDELRIEGATIHVDLPQLDDGSYEITAEHLKSEALTFVYRLLFCFYAEARGGELEILPIDEDCYRLGYSLESLRDLEHTPLTAASEEGTYFHEHLKRLFQLIHAGFHPETSFGTGQQLLIDGMQSQVRTFTVRPLTATLFAPESTPLLNRARLSNRCLQQVIRRLSLSKHDQSNTIGRVNYADLGINQLGAVYEGLLSYKGQFATEDLIHVKPADGDFRDKKTPTWFVPKDRLEEFARDEVERLDGGAARICTRGTFILHLNGIDREQSASYYTPEVLTRCLVEEALRELLKDYGPQDADRILDLKICEPAMGSGAFLNEAASQLAARYLELKQKQLDQTIEPADYGDELRRVKHFITTRNVYGVDLNATAVELGALSLWLGSIHRLRVARGERGGRDTYQPGATPWFGLRLRCGNSLIGARRAVWTVDQLRQGTHVGKQGDVPRLLKPGERRAENEIYHFLVFDVEMVPTHSDKLMRDFWPERCAAAKKWIAQQVKPKWSADEIKEALEICDLIDEHWAKYAGQRHDALEQTACTASVWPALSSSPEAVSVGPSLDQQERIKEELEATSGSFQRLKLVMDTWSALWFWSLENAKELPSREGFLASLRLLFGVEPPKVEQRVLISARLGFEIDALLAAAAGHVPDTAMLCDAVPWLGAAGRIAQEQNFHHWELVFAEVLGRTAACDGFDLIVGNPPWIPVAWSDGAVLAEFDPRLGVTEAKSPELKSARGALLSLPANRHNYQIHFTRSKGDSAVLNSERVYPELVGMQANLYKNFIARCWTVLAARGVAGILHPEGVYNDVGGGTLRSHIYRRLKAHYQFRNQLQTLLFADIPHREEYSINVYSGTPCRPEFRHISNLFHPKTVGACLRHDRPGEPIPGIKTTDGEWDTSPHCHRVVDIGESELALFAKLLDDVGIPPLEARLPQVHAREILNVVAKFNDNGRCLADLDDAYFPTEMFHESDAQEDEIITRQDTPSYQPTSPDDWIVSGPHFFVATPFNKTPRTRCTTKGAYDDIDLVDLPEDYLPKAVYRPGNANGDMRAFQGKIPDWPSPGIPLTSHFRHANREMVSKGAERELVSTILPPGALHINTVFAVAFKCPRVMAAFSSATFSICCDFLMKLAGKGHCNQNMVIRFPIVDGPVANPLVARGLRLCCLTSSYGPLWTSAAHDDVADDSWSTDDNRLRQDVESQWNELDPKKWTAKTPLRTEFARRQALVEIDVLVALGLRIQLDELLTIYRVQFPVLREHELSDSYDARGRHIPNTTRKDSGGTEFRTALEQWKSTGHDPLKADAPPLTVSWEIDDGLQTVTSTFYPPFTKVDREADYARAWEVFEKRYPK